ncbi:hypothetical protein TrVE_jg6965 [Triparma verrucosa]|uniref:EGF-like domain-containing protein n=2 Tax=Triparma TaxID=722752 RepID=A0A9W7E8K5_9STRA|nr:hypothetical protein TrST_g3209 [Triparma strigata]GMH88478.1 hypothetical protein TrVE_jg6965 [Triparma verrucosa]
MFSKVLIALALVAQAAAYCPNGCSGHGSCGSNDKCACYTRPNGEAAWVGHDCSSRTCPTGDAWVAVATAANEAHPLKECSNKGVCDTKTGECACFDGYDGIACERTACPNDCNGRGICQTESALASSAGATYGPDVKATEGTPHGTTVRRTWDHDKAMGCKCDLGFRGPDCSLQECPSGADILGGYGNAQGRDCSGRGICDYSDGMCKCFQGYYGTRCESQTILG